MLSASIVVEAVCAWRANAPRAAIAAAAAMGVLRNCRALLDSIFLTPFRAMKLFLLMEVGNGEGEQSACHGKKVTAFKGL